MLKGFKGFKDSKIQGFKKQTLPPMHFPLSCGEGVRGRGKDSWQDNGPFPPQAPGLTES
jgi:hypothetical protein